MAITAAQLMVRVGADTRDAERGMKEVQQQAKGLGAGLSSVAKLATGAVAALGSIALVRGAFGAARGAVIDFNASMEQSEIAWSTMLKSESAAQKMLADLQQFAKETPFDFPGLEQSARRLLAMGFAAQDVIPMMTTLGDAAAALGLGADGVNRLALALGQMRAKTKVSGEEMRQLTEAGVPAWDILAQAMGKSVQETMKLATQGKIASDVFVQAFQTFSQQNYGGMMVAQSQTFSGAMANIKDSLTMGMADAFQPLFNALSQAAVQIADFVNTPKFEQFAAQVRSSMEKVGEYITNAFSFIMDNAEAIIGGLTGIAAALAIVGATAAVVGLVTAAFNPLVLVIGLVVAASAALGAAWATDWHGIRETTRNVIASVINFWYRLQYTAEVIVGAIETFFVTGWNNMIQALARGAKSMLAIVDKIGAAFGKKNVTAPLIEQIDELAGKAQMSLDNIKPPELKVFEWADKEEKSVRKLTQGMGDLRVAEDGVTAASGATASGIEAVGTAAKSSAYSVGDLVSALIRVHPASIAAAQSVAGWEAQIAGVNAALEANQRRQRSAQAALDKTKARIDTLNQSLSEAKNRLQELSSPRLTGMGQFEMQIQAIQDQIKRIQLAKSLGAPLQDIIAQYPLLTAGAEDFVSTLMPSEKALQKQLEQLRLMQSLEYDERLRLLKNQAQPQTGEMSYAAAVNSINATKAEIEGLTGALAAQEAKARRQEQALAKLRGESERLNDALRDYQTQLQASQMAQDSVNQGLELAYNWFLKDRQAMLDMGGEASTQVDIIDAKARELLGVASTFSEETSAQTAATLKTMTEDLQSQVAQSVVVTRAELDKIPRVINTHHYIITHHIDAGDAGAGANIPGRASGGSVYSGRAYVVGEKGPELFVPQISGQIVPSSRTSRGGDGLGGITIERLVVQGSVLTEKELAQGVYDELLKIRRRNGAVGLA